MTEEKIKKINNFIDQLIEYSVEQDKKNPEFFLFGVMMASSFMTFHLKSLKDYINSEEE